MAGFYSEMGQIPPKTHILSALSELIPAWWMHLHQTHSQLCTIPSQPPDPTELLPQTSHGFHRHKKCSGTCWMGSWNSLDPVLHREKFSTFACCCMKYFSSVFPRRNGRTTHPSASPCLPGDAQINPITKDMLEVGVSL